MAALRPAAVLALALGSGAVGSTSAQDAVPGKGYKDYRVAAGTYLAIELSTPLASDTSREDDQIEGRLLHAVSVDGVELLPEQSVVRGTVREAEPAGKRKRGRLVFAFHVIEHPDTGSVATIRTTEVEFQSDPPKKGKVFPDLRLEKGAHVSVSLLAPLTVRIPAASSLR
jgi:hypothetical protein